MAYFIYGDDTYRSRQKLKAIKAKYVDASLGDTNLAQIDGAKIKGDEIIRQLWAMPFLAPKRLVIIYDLINQGSKDAQQSVQEFLPKIPSTTVAIFYEDKKIDKRNALFKALNQPKLSEEFPLLDPLKLRQWIAIQFKNANVLIDSPSLDFLVKNVGPDLWRQKNEIDKLANHSPEGVTVEKIKQIVHTDLSGDIFQLVDALSTKNIPQIFHHIHGLYVSGESPLYILSMFTYGFRNIIIVKDSLARNPKTSTLPGIHPYVFKKTSFHAKNYQIEDLKKIYKRLLQLDYQTKTGIIDPEAAIDLFVHELCQIDN